MSWAVARQQGTPQQPLDVGCSYPSLTRSQRWKRWKIHTACPCSQSTLMLRAARHAGIYYYGLLFVCTPATGSRHEWKVSDFFVLNEEMQFLCVHITLSASQSAASCWLVEFGQISFSSLRDALGQTSFCPSGALGAYGGSACFPGINTALWPWPDWYDLKAFK